MNAEAEAMLDSITPLHPVLEVPDEVAERVFGEYYRYDLPKWAVRWGPLCYRIAETRTYLLLWRGAERA